MNSEGEQKMKILMSAGDRIVKKMKLDEHQRTVIWKKYLF